MDLDRLCQLLVDFDAEGWWPAEGPFEVMVGALLTQQTNWENVVPVLETLRSKDLMDPASLSCCDRGELEVLVRPTGFYRQKAFRLQRLSQHIIEMHGGEPTGMLTGELGERRTELLSLPGIGPETADSILLFAGGRPKFVAAAYVTRVFQRTGVLPGADYGSAQRLVESRFPDDAPLYRRLYGSLVELAKTSCRVRPICVSCPLARECELKRP